MENQCGYWDVVHQLNANEILVIKQDNDSFTPYLYHICENKPTIFKTISKQIDQCNIRLLIDAWLCSNDNKIYITLALQSHEQPPRGYYVMLIVDLQTYSICSFQ